MQNNVINNNNNHINQTASKLKTEADKINIKYNINPDNVKLNPSTERKITLKDITTRNHSSTQRAKNSNSFREFVIIFFFQIII